MTEADPITPASDDDLQKALAAAFGDDAMQMLDDGDEDDNDQDALLAAIAAEKVVTAEDEEHSQNTDPISQSTNDLSLLDLIDALGASVNADGSYPFPAGALDPGDQLQQAPKEVRYVVFEVGDHQFGIPLSGVQEIARCGTVTPLPRTPAWLSGVTNLRGRIFSVTELRNLFGLSDTPPARRHSGKKVIVVYSDSLSMGTAVEIDRVIGIRSLSSGQMELSKIDDRFAPFATGIDLTDQTTTVLIDPDRLLGCPELNSFAI